MKTEQNKTLKRETKAIFFCAKDAVTGQVLKDDVTSTIAGAYLVAGEIKKFYRVGAIDVVSALRLVVELRALAGEIEEEVKKQVKESCVNGAYDEILNGRKEIQPLPEKEVE